jgi:hypothetical protein
MKRFNTTPARDTSSLRIWVEVYDASGTKPTFLLASLKLLTNFKEKQRRNSTNGREEKLDRNSGKLLEQY